MSGYFTVREPLTITIGAQSHTFYVRELGYLHFTEISNTAGNGLQENDRGLAIMNAICQACIEEEDGSPSYTKERWRDEIKAVINQLSKAAMKAQGLDLDKVKDEKPMTEEEIQGNVKPSRRSGANSQSSSAALSESLSIA